MAFLRDVHPDDKIRLHQWQAESRNKHTEGGTSRERGWDVSANAPDRRQNPFMHPSERNGRSVVRCGACVGRANPANWWPTTFVRTNAVKGWQTVVTERLLRNHLKFNLYCTGTDILIMSPAPPVGVKSTRAGPKPAERRVHLVLLSQWVKIQIFLQIQSSD